MSKSNKATRLQRLGDWLEEYASLFFAGTGFLIAVLLIAFKTKLPDPVKFLGEDFPAFLVGVWWTILGMSLDGVFLKKRIRSGIDNISTKTDALASMTNALIIAKKDLGELTPVRLSISNFSNFYPYLPVYVAIHLKLFEAEDLSVTLTPPSGNDDSAIRALVDGQSDFAITDPSMAIDYHNECLIISPLLSKAALWGISKSPIRRDHANRVIPGQFKKLATYPSPSTAFRLMESWAASLSGNRPRVFPKTRSALLTQMGQLLD